jgi:hypothetical protein
LVRLVRETVFGFLSRKDKPCWGVECLRRVFVVSVIMISSKSSKESRRAEAEIDLPVSRLQCDFSLPLLAISPFKS